MAKPIINLRTGFNNPELLGYLYRKVRVAYRDGRGRKRIKLVSINVKFNCECCGCMVEAVTNKGEVIATACGGHVR